ncbi:oxidoreductase [Agromyces rhizosphaerae]|uniref:Oxidoreductase n=1 Tax=Agromyces rhizosphaerae TaxID=88374 RepID=A0A9W6FPQ0_9MICO|nr:aldo/keto reductase [Agromyces rhizosphaerae]GLI27751.1 oxidoreductase [Agromyces rhizosphaerae]
MESRALRTGLQLTEIGMGVAQFGNLNRETTDEASVAAVDAAWDAGIRYFDTAPHYGLGLSEHRLGRALADRPRDEYVLSTKVGRLLVPSPETADRMDDGFMVPADVKRVWDFSRDGVLRSIEQSLERLGADRIDIVYVHDPDDHGDEALDGAFPALIELRDQGVIGAVGTGMNQSAMPARFVRESDLDVVMLAGRYTLFEQDSLDDLLPLALERGVGIVAAAIYNSGLMSAPTVPDDAYYDYGPAPAHVIERARAIAATCEEFGVTLPEAAIGFPLQHPAVVSVVVGTRTDAHVASTLERFGARLPDGLWRALVERGLLRADAPIRGADAPAATAAGAKEVRSA